MAGAGLLGAVLVSGMLVAAAGALEGIVVVEADALAQLHLWACAAIRADAVPVLLMDASAMLYWVGGRTWGSERPERVAQKVLEFIARLLGDLDGIKVVVSVC
jgi:hypothetical protein